MTAEVVQIHETALTDIPGMLRQAADNIEAGKYGDIETAFLVLPFDGDYPTVFGWGDVEGRNAPALQFELARMWLMMNMVERS